MMWIEEGTEKEQLLEGMEGGFINKSKYGKLNIHHNRCING
jgi:hypothetical protein